MRNKNLMRILSIALTILLYAHSLHAQNNEADTRQVMSDTFFVADVNVENFLRYGEHDKLLLARLTTAIDSQWNLDVNKIESLRFQLSGSFEGNLNDRESTNAFLARIRLKKHEEIRQVIDKMFEWSSPEVRQYKGKTIIEARGEYSPSVAIVDDRTAIFANKSQLEKYLDGDQAKGKIIGLVRAFQKENDCSVAMVNNKHARGFVEAIRKQAGKGLPFNISNIANEISFGSFSLNLSNKKKTTGMIQCKDGKGAERIKGAFEAIFALAKIGIPSVRKSLSEKVKRDFPAEGLKKKAEYISKIQNESLDFATVALDSARFSVNENKVHFKLDGKKDFSKAVILFGKLLELDFSRETQREVK